MDIRRDGLLGNERPPGDIAGVERIEIGQELLAHGRPDAVGADHEIGFGAAAVGKMRHDRLRRLLEAPQPDAAVIALRRKCVTQQPV
jgi:hypothetical protein